MDTERTNDKKGEDLRREAEIGGKTPGRNTSEKDEMIEQTRTENRREADLDDKSPAGDGGPEDQATQVYPEGAKNNY